MRGIGVLPGDQPNFSVYTGQEVYSSTEPVTPFDAGVLQDFATRAMSIIQMNDLREINNDRLKRGLAPIGQAELAPRVNVGLNPGMETGLLLLAGAAVLFLALRK